MSAESLCLREPDEIPGFLRIGVDLDGVLANIEGNAARLIKNKLGVDIEAVRVREGKTNYWWQDWPQIKAIPGGPEFVVGLFANPETYRNVQQMPDSVAALNSWHHQGHQIWIVTARPPTDSVSQATKEWLVGNNLDWVVNSENLLFVPQNYDRNEFKPRIARQLSLHVFLEDLPDTLRRMSARSMMVKILFDASYNTGEEIGSQSVRANDWCQIDKIIQETSRWHYWALNQNVAQY